MQLARGGAAYAEMLSYAYPAIKTGNPNAKVLLGGLAYDLWYSPQKPKNPFDALFLDELLQAGGADHFDVINFHYYPAFYQTWDTGDRYTSNIAGKANYLRQEVLTLGGQNKPIVCTEVGRPTSSKVHDGQVYSDELTARFVIQTYTRAMSTTIHPVIWLQAVDESWLNYAYGLMRGNLAPKPSYDSYRTLTNELGGGVFITVRRDFPITLEGYDFDVAGWRKTVVWANQTAPVSQSFSVAQPGDSLRVVDKIGGARVVADGGAGDLDGARNAHIRLSIGPSPVFVMAQVRPTPTVTTTPTSTLTPTASPTPTSTPSPTATPTAAMTSTPTATASATATSIATDTPSTTPSATAAAILQYFPLYVHDQ